MLINSFPFGLTILYHGFSGLSRTFLISMITAEIQNNWFVFQIADI